MKKIKMNSAQNESTNTFSLDTIKYESSPVKIPPKLVRQNAFIVPQTRTKTVTKK
jgi:hypothetical protein